MPRILPLCLALAFAAPATDAAARDITVTCEVLLPAAPVPGDEGSYLAILRLTVPPGHDAHKHVHGAAEYLEVVSGTGTVTVDGRGELPLHPGDIVAIPPQVQHQQHNRSDTEPLVYTATFVGHVADPMMTRYVGEPDEPSGCPHRQPHGHE